MADRKLDAKDLPLILAEIERRKRESFDLDNFLFAPQSSLLKDDSPFKTAVCSRRAGKTVACAAALLDAALKHPRSVALYITLTRSNAKKIVWRTLKDLNAKYGLRGQVNESDLTITLSNGSQVMLAGASDRSEVEKYRGLGLSLVVIDEAQSFPAYLKELVDEVLAPALMDFNGSVILVGTPAPIPVGYFYECANSQTWTHHAWTVFDNPHIKRANAFLKRELKRRGIKIEDPSIQREFFGKWVYDPNSLVFRFDVTKNTYSQLPSSRLGWKYVIGVDLGFDDADAIAILAFNQALQSVYLLKEDVTTKQGITPLANKLQKLISELGASNVVSIVMDTGGLGKKIADEIYTRFSIPVQAAEKSQKLAYIELLNDALRTSRVYVKADSRFAHDCLLIEWDKVKSKNDKLVISDRFHSDITDAVLYAFRECFHYFKLEEPPAPLPAGSPEEYKSKEDAEIDRYIQERQQAQFEEDQQIWGPEWQIPM